MYSNKRNFLVTSLMLFVFSFATSVSANAGVLEYKLALADDGYTYQVWMKPSATPQPDISLTGQVTLKVPTGGQFNAIKVIAGVEGADWIEASRVNAPKEDAQHDYVSFSFVGLQSNSARNFSWQEGQEQLVFSFKNENGCLNGVHIMPMDDPFAGDKNSASTNAGNQFTNLGWGAVGDNNFKGIYGDAIQCAK